MRNIPHPLQEEIFDSLHNNDINQMRLIFSSNQINIRHLEMPHQNILIEAVRLERPEMVEFFLEQGANPNFVDEDNDTPLAIAAAYGFTDILRTLLEKGANINFPEQQEGHTALNLAVMNYHHETAKLLMVNGADPNISNRSGMSPLLKVLKEGYDERMLKILLNNKDDITITETQLLKLSSNYTKYLKDNAVNTREIENLVIQKISTLLNNPELRAEFVARNNLIDELIDSHSETDLIETIIRINSDNAFDEDKKISTTLSKMTPDERHRLVKSLHQKVSAEHEVIPLKNQTLISILQEGFEFPDYTRAPSPQMSPQGLASKPAKSDRELSDDDIDNPTKKSKLR